MLKVLKEIKKCFKSGQSYDGGYVKQILQNKIEEIKGKATTNYERRTNFKKS